jgi:SAM-dependent methyltransferase
VLTAPADNTCRLCGSNNLSLISKDERHSRPFYLCPACALISVPAQYHLSVEDELARYTLHDNTLSNQGYVDFLSEIADIAADLASEMSNNHHSRHIKLLDFGCGKEAVLCRLLERRGIGIDCQPYDPLYDELRQLPDIVDKCDIIAASEVVEHLRDIAGELRLMGRLLRDDGGVVILRTQLYDDCGINVTGGGTSNGFRKWWYAQDPTHINFFNRQSLSKLASVIDKRVEETERRDIFILR